MCSYGKNDEHTNPGKEKDSTKHGVSPKVVNAASPC